MDNLQPQSGGLHGKEGHEESDLSIRGIIWFGVSLAVGGVAAFLLMGAMIWGLEKWEKKQDAQLTPMEQQREKERETPKEGLGKVPAVEGEVKPPPDWYGRGKIEEHLGRTFRTPRLQYDDEHDMSSFRGAENEWLESTGKDSNGNIHIPVSRAMDLLAQRGLPPVSGPFLPANASAPSAVYPSGNQPAAAPEQNSNRGNRGGAKP